MKDLPLQPPPPAKGRVGCFILVLAILGGGGWWWWTYRIDFYKPQGFADIAIYDGQGFRTYTNEAYFQGAHFLEDLRTRIGDDAFFAFIQDYLVQGRGKIVTANDFFRILKEHTLTDYSDIVRQYFQNIY